MQDGSILSMSGPAGPEVSYLPSGIKPSNFIKIDRPGGNISGAFVIDRHMKIPDRAKGYNLYLSSVPGAGSIKVDIFSVPPAAAVTAIERKERTMINITGEKILANFHRPQIDEKSYPFHVIIGGSSQSTSTLSLPRSFKGPVRFYCTGDWVTFSPDLLANFTLFIEEKGVTEGFVGDFDFTQWEAFNQWKGDVFYWRPASTTTTMLILRYNDEDF
ncbi:hypothetical protein CPB83DRAFT_864525 [Crepidotus variabilis]|uniref:DUF7330 domain-containing protein n=1 Tax=Crepidotus variabilis TaxID=179855 RepID=A0A9P6E4R6_9AGAR|nr:hypothetical protein CPB83DRAFT_864525 [Crepidotus variabilis]